MDLSVNGTDVQNCGGKSPEIDPREIQTNIVTVPNPDVTLEVTHAPDHIHKNNTKVILSIVVLSGRNGTKTVKPVDVRAALRKLGITTTIFLDNEAIAKCM